MEKIILKKINGEIIMIMINFRLTIVDEEITLYDYGLEFEYTPPYSVVINNSKYITAIMADTMEEGPFGSILTHIKSDGYTVTMDTDYEFGLTINTGYCK